MARIPRRLAVTGTFDGVTAWFPLVHPCGCGLEWGVDPDRARDLIETEFLSHAAQTPCPMHGDALTGSVEPPLEPGEFRFCAKWLLAFRLAPEPRRMAASRNRSAAVGTLAALRFYDSETREIMYDGDVFLYDGMPQTGTIVQGRGERLKIARRRQQRGEVHCRAYVYRIDEVRRIGVAVRTALGMGRHPKTNKLTESFEEAAQRILRRGPERARPVALAVLAQGPRHERMRRAAAAALIIGEAEQPIAP